LNIVNSFTMRKSAVITHHYIIQVVRWLLEAGVRINRKNLRGRTALDIFQQMGIDNNEMRAMLVLAGASSGSPPTVKSYAAFLKSHPPLYSSHILIKSMLSLDRERRNMTNELRSILLVVVVLFITTTYQAALSPPGGVWQDDYNPSTDQCNSTFPTNCTSLGFDPDPLKHKAGKVIMSKTYFSILGLSNFICFVLSAGIIFLLLPPHFTSLLFFSPMILLYVSYLISYLITSP
jgi:hypothetical protein